MTDPDADEPVTPAESGRLAFPDPVVPGAVFATVASTMFTAGPNWRLSSRS